MKKLFLLLACLLALLATPVKASAGDPDIVLVRVYENYTSVSMSITRGPGKSEYLEFINGISEKRLPASGEGYYKALFKLYQEGYSLQSTFTTQISTGSSLTTLVLVKSAKL
ncbi:hypothetical protein [Hymenobacter sp. UYCo722]|uniref:hypothetical protein n=1 Tax=Hymenobacter sp. UYCo722 TaxID=3156335 RepID=UPI003395EE71